jgi:hypothetical protein
MPGVSSALLAQLGVVLQTWFEPAQSLVVWLSPSPSAAQVPMALPKQTPMPAAHGRARQPTKSGATGPQGACSGQLSRRTVAVPRASHS